MHIILGNSNNINEGYEERIPNFRDLDYVIGPDGTIYQPKFIMALVNNASDILMEITQGTITKYLGALPILYTFNVPTMATDGKFIYINPGFVMELYKMTGETVMGISFVLLHEVYHNLFLHMQREQADPAHFTDHDRANDAQDYEINLVIEQSFPDMRDPKTAKEEDGDDYEVFNPDGSRVQIFDGVTKMCHGLINEKFAGMPWEDIYDKLTSKDRSNQSGDDDNEDKDKDEDAPIKMSDDFNDGYRNGWNDAIRELRAQGLVESITVTIYNDFIAKSMKLFEGAGSDDYNAGYAMGKQKAMEMIKQILNPPPPMPGGGPQPKQPRLNPIKGLDTMKPLNAPDRETSGSSNQDQDPNTPVEMESNGGKGDNNKNNQTNQNQKNQKGQQGGQDGQQGGQGGQQGNQNGQQGGQDGQQDGQQGGQGGQQGNQNGQQGGQDGGNPGGQEGGTGTGGGGGQQKGQKGGQQGGQQGNGQGGSEDEEDGEGSGDDGQNGNGQGQGGYEDVYGKSGQNDDGTFSNTGDRRSVDQAGDGLDGTEGTTSAQQAIDKMYDGKDTVKVGHADGKYSGKDQGVSGRHIISEGEGEKLQKQAGYEEPVKDKAYAGRQESPFKDEAGVQAALNELNRKALLGAKPGSGRGPYQAAADKIKEVLTPIINWKEELEKYLDGYFAELVDVGWNKKGITRDIYTRFDDYEGMNLHNLVIMIDTSGSVVYSGDYLNQIVSEFNEIGRKMNPKCIDLVLFCDGVYYHEDIEGEDIPDLSEIFKKSMQSGGTSYQQCFDYLERRYGDGEETFACVIIFTDTDLVYCANYGGLPDEEDIFFEPGHEPGDGGKLLWFMLNDDNSHVELPYGALLEVSQDQFKKTMDSDKYITTNESKKIQIPRRSIMKKDKLYEGTFKKVTGPSQRAAAAAAAAEAPEAPPAPVLSPEELEAKAKRERRAKLVALRRSQLRSLAASGQLESYKRKAMKWVIDNTNIREYDFTSSWNKKAEITDDLYINVDCDLVITGKALTEFEGCVTFGKVNGNLEIGMNGVIDTLPDGLPEEVTGDFVCVNMRRLSSLYGAPKKVGKNYIIQNCPNLETLDGAPESLDDFSGYFMYDGDKFTNDDFYETIENGGVMVLPSERQARVAESMSPKRFNKLVESRIALGKNFSKNLSLNEAFSSNILTRLAKNPNNRAAIDAMRDMQIFWSKIPDEIITPVYHSVTKLIGARRVVNKDRTMFGVTICCDEDDTINVIVTGDNKGEWAGNTWIYMKNGLLNLINQRVDLVRRANGRDWHASSQDEENAQRECERLGINWSKSDIQKLGQVSNVNYLLFPHMYLVPELCAKGYVIKGIDDSLAANSSDPEYARGFSYMRDRDERRKLSVERERANAGVVMPSTGHKVMTDYDEEGNPVERRVSLTNRKLENDPAYQRYKDSFIDEDILRSLRTAQGRGLTYINVLKSMKDSVNTTSAKVRTALVNLIKEDEMESDKLDLLYRRYLLSTQRGFNKKIEAAISSMQNSYDYGVKPYAEKMFKGKDSENSPSLAGIRRREYPSFPDAGDIPLNRSEFYDFYIQTVKIFAQIMSAINAYKRGNNTLFDAYINKLNQVVDSYSSALSADSTTI